MIKHFFLLIAIATIFYSCKSDIEKKFDKIDEINAKYKSTNLRNLSEIDAGRKKIEKFVSYFRTMYGTNAVPDEKVTTDSLLNILLNKNDIKQNQYNEDRKQALEIFPDYFDDGSEIYYKKSKVSRDISIAFANDENRTYEDLFHYVEKGYFTNGERKGESISSFEKPKATKDEVEKWMSGWNGSIRDFVTKVKSDLKDPESFKHIETSYNNKNSRVIVRMKFSAKNAIGGNLSNIAEGILNIQDGTVNEIKLLN